MPEFLDWHNIARIQNNSPICPQKQKILLPPQAPDTRPGLPEIYLLDSNICKKQCKISEQKSNLILSLKDFFNLIFK